MLYIQELIKLSLAPVQFIFALVVDGFSYSPRATLSFIVAFKHFAGICDPY